MRECDPPPEQTGNNYLHDPVKPSLASVAMYGKRRLYGIEPSVVTDKTDDVEASNTEIISDTAGLETIERSTIRIELLVAFRILSQRAKYIDVTNPATIEEFTAVAVSYRRLAETYQRMELNRQKPQFIVTMHMPLTPRDDGDKLNYRTLLSKIAADKSIPNDPFKQCGDINKPHSVLNVSGGLQNEENSKLYEQEINLIKQEAANDECHYVEKNGVIYTLGLISGTNKPQSLGDAHRVSGDRHSTISQLLTLNIDRIIDGKALVDSQTATWGYGTFSRDEYAPFVGSQMLTNRLYVGSSRVLHHDYSKGSRLRTWG